MVDTPLVLPIYKCFAMLTNSRGDVPRVVERIDLLCYVNYFHTQTPSQGVTSHYLSNRAPARLGEVYINARWLSMGLYRIAYRIAYRIIASLIAVWILWLELCCRLCCLTLISYRLSPIASRNGYCAAHVVLLWLSNRVVVSLSHIAHRFSLYRLSISSSSIAMGYRNGF